MGVLIFFTTKRFFLPSAFDSTVRFGHATGLVCGASEGAGAGMPCGLRAGETCRQGLVEAVAGNQGLNISGV